MDLIMSSWHPSTFEGGRVLVVPANYGTEGSMADWDWTPTYVPPVSPNVHVPTYNRVVAIDWNQYVMAPDEIARIQASLTQVPMQSPAEFVPPTTASLRVKD